VEVTSVKHVAKRYQLKKEAAAAVKQGHPWIYRSQMSTAAEVFKTGQWLKLLGPQNDVLGYGRFDADGLIAIRVFKQGSTAPDANWFDARIDRALAKREQVRKYTDAFRAIHGENDSLPGIVVDVYGDCCVLQTYSASVDALGRLVARRVLKKLGLKSAIWKFPVKRKTVREDRILSGKIREEVAFREGKLQLKVSIEKGQKSGAFLDLRGLRKWVSLQNLNGKRVLNLFSYTGTLGLAAEVAGAKEIWNVDVSKGALDVAKRLHTLQPKKHKFIAADIFEWFSQLDPKERFDLVIVDPPMMASRKDQVETALKAYRKLYREAEKHLSPRGQIVVCCCTSRITRGKFEQTVASSFGNRLKKKQNLPPEDDHPVTFPEGDYLKVLVYQS
jgi:23S rRNA (cytosine1962-C5)-methyltransferase